MDVSFPFWSRVTYSQLPESVTLATLARASHSSVMWKDNVLIYGGYQFPHDGYSFFRPLEHQEFGTIADDHTNSTNVQLLQYNVESTSWELFMTSSIVSGNDSAPLLPSPRYGHSAIVYNVSTLLQQPLMCNVKESVLVYAGHVVCIWRS